MVSYLKFDSILSEKVIFIEDIKIIMIWAEMQDVEMGEERGGDGTHWGDTRLQLFGLDGSKELIYISMTVW